MLFDSEELAWTALRDDVVVEVNKDETLDPPWRAEILRLPCEVFDLFGYQVLPVRYFEGQQEAHPFSDTNPAPLPADYQKLGYDVVSWSGTSHFGCCPLFCNGDARALPVNQHCLLDEPALALDRARYYSETDWKPGPHYCGRKDPGPYWVVEVWRKRKPFPEPQHCGDHFQWDPRLLKRLVCHEMAHGDVYRKAKQG